MKNKTNLPPSKEKLHDSVAKFKTIYDISPGLICVANANNGIFIECNLAVTSILGWSVKEFTSKPFNEYIHPDDQQKTVDIITEQLKGKPVANFQNRYRCKDGSYKWLAWQATAIDKNGLVHAVATDITESKQREENLLESEEKFKFVSNNLQEGLWITDNKDRMIYFNKKMEEISGVSKQDFIGLSVIKDFPKETTQHFLPYYKIAKKELRPTYYEADVVTPAGKKTIQSGWLIPRNQDGKYFGMVCTIEDITEHKQAELALEESEKKYSDLYNNAPDMFVSVDAKTTLIRDCNQTLATNLGYLKKEIIGKPIFDMYHADSHEGANRVFKEFVEKGEVHDAELQLKRKDGSKLDVSLNVSSVKDKNGTVLYSRSVWRDITERKQAEEKLKSRNKELETWAEVTTDRELFMLELKKEINELLEKSGKKPKYKIPI